MIPVCGSFYQFLCGLTCNDMFVCIRSSMQWNPCTSRWKILTCLSVEWPNSQCPTLCSAPHSPISSHISSRIWGGPIATSTISLSINKLASVQVELNTQWNSWIVFLLHVSICTFGFLSGQLAEIQKVSLARIICDNSDGTIREIQPKAFRTPNEYEFFKLNSLYCWGLLLFYRYNNVYHLISNFNRDRNIFSRIRLLPAFNLYVFFLFFFSRSLNRLTPCRRIPGIDFSKMSLL